MVITGPADKLIDTVTLEMTQGSHKAQAEEVVGLKFGANHTIKLKADSFDFKFTNAEIAASGIDFSKNGVVDFSLVAKVGYSDEEFSVDIGSAEILTQYHLPRYQKLNDRADRKVGGDDWVKPDIIPALKWFSSHNKFEYGDASNMNGGSFKPDHASHRKGLSVDTYVRGYNHKVKDKNGHKKIEVTINGVKKIAKAIDNSPYQDEIQKIYISYSKTVKHFIEHQINHGHSEYKLFSDHVGHTTHFHLEFFDV